MIIRWESLFDHYGAKTVTATDESKAAYLPNAAQRVAIEAAGIAPADDRPGPGFLVQVLFDPQTDAVEASYYYSRRSAQADRTPEPRMGREIISSWMREGDEVVIGNIGSQLYVAKVRAARQVGPDAPTEIASKIDPQRIARRAAQAAGKPAKVLRQRFEYVRDPYVVAAAVLRAEGSCEMPNCGTALFTKEDGSPFLEVHHVTPLAEDGDDTLVNAAALCPMCHRELHFGAARIQKRAALAAAIRAKS